MSIPIRHQRSALPASLPARTRAAKSQRGETLVEVVATVALMGLGFTALLQGLLAITKATQVNQERTMASLAVQTWSEWLQQPAIEIPAVTTQGQIPQNNFTRYFPCANIGGSLSVAPPSGWVPIRGQQKTSFTNATNFTATITRIRYVRSDGTGKPLFDALTKQPLWWDNISDCYNSWAYGHPVAVFNSDGTPLLNTSGQPVSYLRDGGLQEITMTIDSGPRKTGRVVEQLVVIKRDQRCPATFDNADLGPC